MSDTMEGSRKNFVFYFFGTSFSQPSFLFKVELLKATLSRLFFSIAHLSQVLPAQDVAFKRTFLTKDSGEKSDSTSKWLKSEKK